MKRTEFMQLADESLIFAQCKAEQDGVSHAQVELWSHGWRRDASSGLITPLHKSPLTNPNDATLPYFLRKQAF